MSEDKTAREKLTQLADAILQDILETPDVDIVAEIDSADIERARAIIVEVTMNVSKRLLIEAKAQHEAWSTSRSHNVRSFEPSAARDHFARIRRGDPDLNQKLTLAARNGKSPSESDIAGMADDWADLQRLDGNEPEE